MVSKRILLTLALLLAVGALWTGCRTLYDSPADFRESRKRIEQGQQKEEVGIITRDFKDIPREYQDEAVATVDAAEGEVGQQGLIALLEHPQVRDANTRKDIASRLMQRDEDGSAEALLVACQNRPDLVNAEIIDYFGRKRYAPAIPFLRKQAEAGPLALESVKALIQMKAESADDFVFSLADSDRKEAIRMEALKGIAEMEGETMRDRKAALYEKLVRAHGAEPGAVTGMAIEGLAGLASPEDPTRAAETKSAFEALLDLYETSPHDELRAQALVAMAKLRGVAPDVIEREYKNAMADVDAEMELLRNRKRAQKPSQPEVSVEKAERQKERPAPARKKSRKPRGFGKDYRQALDRQFTRAFGSELGRSLMARLNNSLLSYADWSDSDASTRFILRSYRKHYGGDDASARARLKEGLQHPGSLTVILKNVMAEYKSDEMRVYAISQFFGIKRWEASMLLDMVRSGKI